MTPAQYQLLHCLQHGPRRGPELGQALNISRAAVWKQVRGLRQLGIDVHSDTAGYHLPAGLELLSSAAIEAAIEADVSQHCRSVQVLASIDSTNAQLWRQESLAGQVLLAESQQAGRGRRGRQWYSPPCSNLYFSMGWQFPCGIGALGLLSTQVAVSCALAIESLQPTPVQLKWPNDLYRDGRKLGGILIELRATPDGPSAAVIGIGLNVHMPADAPIDQAFTSLSRDPGGHPAPSRNALAAALINQLCRALSTWPRPRPQDLLEQWQARDYLADQAILIDDGHSPIHGEYLGIDGQGGLRYRLHGQELSCHSGEVSVRRG